MGTPPAFSGNEIRVGYSAWIDVNNHIVGQLDDTAIFSRHLGSDEINTIMTGDFSAYIDGYSNSNIGSSSVNVNAPMLSSALLMLGLTGFRRKKNR